MKLMRYNSKGMEYVLSVLHDAFYGEFTNKVIPHAVIDTLFNEKLIEPVEFNAAFDQNRLFDNSQEFTNYFFDEVLGGSHELAMKVCQDPGIMTFVAIAYLEQLATPVDGGIKIGQIERYYMAENTGSGTGRITRHMVRSPLLLKTVYGHMFEEQDNFILARSSMSSMSHLYERWLWSDNVRRNPAAMRLGNRYFWHLNAMNMSVDDISDRASDLAHVIGQFFKKLDLEGITELELAEILASEPVLERDMKGMYTELSLAA